MLPGASTRVRGSAAVRYAAPRSHRGALPLVCVLVLCGCHVGELAGGGSTRDGAPAPPAALAQYQADGITPVQPGATVADTRLALAGTLTGQGGDSLRLQVEVRPVGVAFSDAVTHESARLPDGARAIMMITGLAADTAFHWQARSADGAGRTSAWATFGGNGEAEPDFRVTIPRPPPAAPAGLAQRRLDGVTPIAEGGSADEDGITIAATVTSPESAAQIRLQAEVRPVGVAFTGTPTDSGASVATGALATATVSGLSDDTDYHWRVRAVDDVARTSAWVAFGANAESDADFRVEIPQAPSVPSGLGQFRSDGSTVIPVGGTSGGTGVVLRGTVSDPDPGDALVLQMEVRAVGTAFSGTPTHSSTAVAAGASASVAATAVATVGYHWRSRTCDATGCSGWVSFGGNAESEADFVGSLLGGSGQPPASPGSASQYRTDGTTPLTLGETTDQTGVILAALVTDPDAGASVRLQVELRPVASAFTAQPTQTSDAMASGAVAFVQVLGLADSTSYHWRYRALDETDRASAWSSFGGNADGASDFRVETPAPPPPPPPPPPDPVPPDPPSSLGQFRSNGSAIPVGGNSGGLTVELRARVDDPDSSASLTLEFELRDTGTAFSDATHQVTGLTTGQEGRVSVGVVVLFGYHWRVRACDADGCSSWVAFGGNAESDADVVGSLL